MIDTLSNPWLMAVFVVATIVVVLASIKATQLADTIADRTGMGEAMVGGLVLGGATSLSGVVVSVTAASSGDASFAISNAVGGIAAQTPFLAIADLIYRRANLEHAAAEATNLIQGVLLITHYQRLLDYVSPDYVHVLYDGRLLKTGGKELALELEERGYGWIQEERQKAVRS